MRTKTTMTERDAHTLMDAITALLGPDSDDPVQPAPYTLKDLAWSYQGEDGAIADKRGAAMAALIALRDEIYVSIITPLED